MSAHNKTQFTDARINCVLKDSSYDTPLPKILMLAILASNASSSSTKAFECPHTNDDSIFTRKGLPEFSNQHLLRLSPDHKGLNKACNGVECKGMESNSNMIINLILHFTYSFSRNPQRSEARFKHALLNRKEN
ncbi:hypothetical protein H5410_021564 [Solanum commersonii]|uniref:Uncharacterized protein n=1 Tax=Solanum commersonii TaxID=4109 RepID=A0A9J5ZBC9_SOLCO|nr:hypothetical protein H5410_021564 [Solanum commersonii]